VFIKFIWVKAMSDQSNSPVLELSDVWAGYADTIVLEGISLSLPPRGSLAILGRNGVGKTTLLATIMGHTQMKSGRIEFKDQSIEKAPIFKRSRLGIGYVPQTRDIFPSLTVAENLKVAQRPGRWPIERVYDLFPRLSERQHNMGNQLSGGEQQMLAMGRALMGNPDLLLLDEPMEGLAPIIVEMLLRVIERLIKEESLSVILVEQSAKLALGVTQEVLVLSRGQIIHQGQSEALLNNPDLLAQLIVAH
jgi:branched-chain amino acid transport system ATP-binding protein